MSAGLWGTADFLSRKTSKSIGHYLTSSYLQLFSFISLIVVALRYNLRLSMLNLPLLALNLSLGALVFLSLLFKYRGLSQGLMSIVAPIAGAYPIVTIALAFIVLGQSLSPFDASAIACVIIGAVLSGINLSDLRIHLGRAVNSSIFHVSERNHQTTGSRDQAKVIGFVKGLDSAVLSCLLAGSFLFCEGTLTPSLGWLLPIVLVKGSAAVIAFGCILPLKQEFKLPNLPNSFCLVLMGIMDALGYLAFNFGIILSAGYLPIVATFASLSGLMILALAHIFYGERLGKAQWLGICLILIGASAVLYLQHA